MTSPPDRAAEVTDWFWGHLVRVERGCASDVTYRNTADAPRCGSWHDSPLGHSLCLFSDYPMGDESDWIYRILKEFHSGSVPRPDSVPVLYARMVDFLSRGPEAYWFLSHRIDNAVLSCEPGVPFTRPITHEFMVFRDYPTTQTAARELTLLSAATDWLLSFEFDGEVFAVFLHAGPAVLAEILGCPVPDSVVINDDPAMMTELVNSCRFGGNWAEISAIDDRYRLRPHEWRQVVSWLFAAVSSAAENEQARGIAATIEAKMIALRNLTREEPCR